MLAYLTDFFASRQELLWLLTVVADLGSALLMYRLFGKMGLYASVVLSILLANLQGPKLIIILGMQTSMGVIIYSGIYFATDMLSEKYGKREANRAVMIGFLVSCIILLMISISLMYQPSTDPETGGFSRAVHEAFATLFDYTPRFVLGSLAAYYISQHLDVFLFHAIRARTGVRHLWLRNNGSTMVSQGADTLIYSLVVWWGLVDLNTAIELGVSKYLIKLVIAALDTPFIYWGRRWDTRKQDWHSGTEAEGSVVGS
ncbi:MAG: queuosine precursor transporter [Deltaproteobacteria bacterium]|nr:queuosine precursor transporter [Deltaproteobacteria bacterium]